MIESKFEDVIKKFESDNREEIEKEFVEKTLEK